MKKLSLYLPIIIAISFVAGMYISSVGRGSFLINSNNSSSNKLDALFTLIENEYADSISKDEIIEIVIPEILKKLDPHSSYIVPEKYEDMHAPLMGSFEGIGVQFNIQNDTVIVIQIIPGGPSEKVGLLAGDRIISVEGEIIAGKQLLNSDIVKLLKGHKGSQVKVGIKRKGTSSILPFTIIRDQIPIYSIDISYILKDDIGYMKISRFASTTPQEFTKHIKKLRKLGMKKLIIDLRENSGGVLNSAVFLANEFLNKDDLIVYTKGKSQDREDYICDGKGSCKDIKLEVLINEYSASASEVFAGAIQDNDRGKIIGRRSFGKGLVNRDFPFLDSSIVRLTVRKFYSPSGRCIQKSFKKGYDEYNNDLSNRFAHGEMEDIDSIHFPDSLKFKTKNGKVVYGGGGIMPEIFVPLDTIGYSEFYSALVDGQMIYDFAFEFADNNRVLLRKFKTADEIFNYLQKINITKKLVEYAQTKGAPYTYKDLQNSITTVETRVAAYIARNIIGDEGFYPIIHKQDKTIRIAIEKIE